MHSVVLKPALHRGAEIIGVEAPYLRGLHAAIRKIKGIQWSQTHRFWYLPLGVESHHAINAALKGLATIDVSALTAYLHKRKAVRETEVPKPQRVSTTTPTAKPVVSTPAWRLSLENVKALGRLMEQLKLKAYSASTLKTYRNEFLQLLQLLKKKRVDDLTPDDLRRYFVYCFEKLKLSENTLHSRINAVKFYFEQVLGRENFFWEIPRPKKEIQNPKFFN